jgi:hypothetical protein
MAHMVLGEEVLIACHFRQGKHNGAFLARLLINTTTINSNAFCLMQVFFT